MDSEIKGTIGNISRNPAMELNVVDPFSRKGFRFKGTAPRPDRTATHGVPLRGTASVKGPAYPYARTDQEISPNREPQLPCRVADVDRRLTSLYLSVRLMASMVNPRRSVTFK